MSAKMEENAAEISPPAKPELTVLDPEHPLLEKFQKTLKEHLLLQIESLKEEIFEYETGTKKTNISIDELGVQTYEAQQMVCKQQKVLEGIIEELQNVTAAREEIEAVVQEKRLKQKEETEKLLAAQKSDSELQNEIGGMNLLIHQMTQWEDKMESDIVVNQRISEKTRKDNLRLVEEKRAQDFIIYKLFREIWKLESEIETLDMQMQVKEKERDEMAQTVALGNTNIDALQAEYRCLMHSWSSVIVAIGNRDKVLDCLNVENHKLQEKLKNIFSEIEQVKKLTKREMLQNELFTALKNRVENDIKNCKSQIDAEMMKRQSLENDLTENQAIIEQVEQDIKKMGYEEQSLEATFSELKTEHEKLTSEKLALEGTLMDILEGQITNDKVAMNLHKFLTSLKQKNNSLEILLAETENKQRNRLLGVESQSYLNKENKTILLDLEQEVKGLETEANRLKSQITKNEIVIRSKERTVEVLNVRVEKLVTDGVTAVTPQDIKISSLEKHIEELLDRIKKLQSYWLREQRNLITVSKERQEQIHNSNLLKKQILILEQKNLRINNEIDALEKHQQKIIRNINKLQNKCDLLCETLNNKRGYKSELHRKTDVFKIFSDCKLKDSELECLQLEAEITDIEEDKVNLSKELIEFNREALEWEKKVQLAKETKEHIREEKSTSGEVEMMKQEIHRMNVRYSQLKKAQEKLILDLEHCVSRRGAIFVESEARQKRSKGSEDRVRINFTRKMDDIRNKIKQVDNEIKIVQKKLDDVQIEKTRLGKEISSLEMYMDIETKSMKNILENIETNKTSRQLKFELLLLNQKKLNMYSELAKGRVPYTIYRSEPQLTTEYNKQKEINNKLSMIVENLSSDFPNHSHELNRIYNSLKLSIFMTYN